MGTRNLTIVIDKSNNLKVAQYGQWDGCPSGQGLTILRFSRDKNNIELLQKRFSIMKFYNTDIHDIDDYINNYNNKAPKLFREQDNRTSADKYWWETTQSRNLGGKILQSLIDIDLNLLPEEHSENIYLFNDIDFLKDSLMCEWAYCINLYTNKLQVFQGFNTDKSKEHELCVTNQEQIDEEFQNYKYKYYGCKLIKEFDLNDLPDDTTFLKEINKLLSEDEEC